MSARLWWFVGGEQGQFSVVSTWGIKGETLPEVHRLHVGPGLAGETTTGAGVSYALKGMVSNERYVTQAEKTGLTTVQQPLGRPRALWGALIPIKKHDHWWALSQEERRRIFEERSAHIAIGQRALPAIARRLHHCRDLESEQPFDFLTWFDFAPEHTQMFDDLLGALRATEEWQYVEREVEVRVVRRPEA